jgi:4-amino-4-deoxy-L-arabinose transferase-like glycosyltransferase
MQENETSTNLGQRIVAQAEVIAQAGEKHSGWLLSSASALYLIVVGLIAVRKPLENDELFTLNIARLPSLSEVWAALLTGGEQLPPLFYVLTRAARAVLGENSFALRLPALLGVWVMSVCLYCFVAKRATALYGLAAFLFPLTTGAYYYTFEARPYGLVLGFSGLALVCWQLRAEGERRVLPLVGLALSLAAAIACHYYAVLALIPFACGEAMRAWERRRVDVAVWAALLFSLTPLLFVLPLIERARTYSKGFWAQPVWGDVPDFYSSMLLSAALPVTAILLLAALYAVAFPAADRAASEASSRGLLRHEAAAAVGWLAIPVVAVAIAMFITRAYTHRYVLPGIMGLGILVPFGFRQLLRARAALAFLLALALAFSFAIRGRMTLQEAAKYAQRREQTIAMMQAQPEKDVPIACSDGHLFLGLSHYAPPEIRARLVYLADKEASRRYLGHDSLERGMFELLKPWFRLNVQEYRPFLAARRPFLLCGDAGHFLNWVFSDLAATEAQLELRGRNQGVLLFLVRPGTGGEKKGKQPE